MTNEFQKIKKLIEEVQKPNRELLYNLASPDYKNNFKKQIVWSEIAEELSINRIDAQKLWKRTKAKYRAALFKENAPSGSARRLPKPLESFLLKEMDFLKDFLDDKEPRMVNSSIQQCAVEEIGEVNGADADVSFVLPKKRTKALLEKQLGNTLEKLEDIASQLIKPKAGDPFYTFLEEEMGKKSEETRAQLKRQITALVLQN